MIELMLWFIIIYIILTIACYIVVTLIVVTAIHFTNNFMKGYNKYIKEYNISLKEQLEIIYFDEEFIEHVCIFSFLANTFMLAIVYLIGNIHVI